MEPAALKGRFGGGRVFQIPFHQGAAAKHKLTQRATVRWDVGHRLRVDDTLSVKRQIGHTLARHPGRALRYRQVGPGFLPGTDRGRAIAFGQTVEVGDAKAHLFHRLDHRRRRAAPPVATSTTWSKRRFTAWDAFTSRLRTIGAPQRWVTWCSAIAAKIGAGLARRRQTWVPATAVTAQV